MAQGFDLGVCGVKTGDCGWSCEVRVCASSLLNILEFDDGNIQNLEQPV